MIWKCTLVPNYRLIFMCYFLIPSSHVPTFIHVLCVPSDGFPVRSCFFLNRCHCINVTVIFCDMETLEFLIVSGRLEIYIVHFLILKLSHSSYATLPQGLCNVIHSFEVNTPFCCFLLSHWRPPILIVTLCGGYSRLSFVYSFSETAPHFLCNCYARFL